MKLIFWWHHAKKPCRNAGLFWFYTPFMRSIAQKKGAAPKPLLPYLKASFKAKLSISPLQILQSPLHRTYHHKSW